MSRTKLIDGRVIAWIVDYVPDDVLGTDGSAARSKDRCSTCCSPTTAPPTPTALSPR